MAESAACVAFVLGPHRTHLGGLVPQNVRPLKYFQFYKILNFIWTVWLLTVWSWSMIEIGGAVVQVEIDEISKLNSTVILICSKLDIIWLLYNWLRWCKGYQTKMETKDQKRSNIFNNIQFLIYLDSCYLGFRSCWALTLHFVSQWSSCSILQLILICFVFPGWWWGWDVKLV